MKLLITILSLLVLWSCSPAEVPLNGDIPTPPTTDEPDEPEKPIPSTMKITIGNTSFTVTIATNAAAAAFGAMLPITLNMSDFNSNEKVCSLSNSLPTAASNPSVIHTGDIMLYGSSSLVLFYETFSTSYSYTRIGQVDNVAGLKAALGSGNVTITFEVE